MTDRPESVGETIDDVIETIRARGLCDADFRLELSGALAKRGRQLERELSTSAATIEQLSAEKDELKSALRITQRVLVAEAEAVDLAPESIGGVPTQRLLPAMHNPAHEEPFAAFVQAMADELRTNAHKGDRAGWLTMSEREAVSEVLYHAAKLAYAARKLTQGQESAAVVLEYAADVANCALMVADVCGALTEEPVDG